VTAYLAANIHGLGPSRARDVVKALGRTAITQLLAEPELIARALPGVRGQALVEPTHEWAERAAAEGAGVEVEAQLIAAGLGPTLARRAARFFSSPVLGAILAAEAPYRLLAVPGIGWATTDAVAQRLGVAIDAPVRLVAAAEAALREAMDDGHSCLARPALAEAMRPLVGDAVAVGAIDAALRRAEGGGRIVRSADRLYLPQALDAEWRIADAVATLAARHVPLTAGQRAAVRPIVEARVHIGTPDERDALSPAQREAVWLGLEHGLAILTGRPGAGKTSTVAVFLRACAALGRSVTVAAPTGKAASRAGEVADVQAGTLHRLIGGPPGQPRDTPLDADVIVVDETSMCSAETLAWLLLNLDTARTRVLLVGDPAQLPSVEHGAVLRDLLGVASIPRVQLTESHRTASGSEIVRAPTRSSTADRSNCGADPRPARSASCRSRPRARVRHQR
jgi:exodeoxyribonuclease V alpha subunit